MSQVRDEILPAFAKSGLRLAVQGGGGPGGGGGGIQFMVQGPDLAQLESYSNALQARRRSPFPASSTWTPRSTPASPRCR